MKRLIGICLLSTIAVVISLTVAGDGETVAAEKKAKPVLENIQSGSVEFKRIGRMSFGPDGVLLVADVGSASVVAIQTGDSGPMKKLSKKVEDVDKKLAALLGVTAEDVQLVDMAVNKKSGTIYMSLHRKSDGVGAIATVNGDGELALLSLKKASYVRVPLPVKEGTVIRNITGVEFTNGRVLAAGQCNEEFASKIYSLPLPLTHGKSAAIYSTETYHVAHGRWETRAPIQSFVPYVEDGENFIVGSFSCTPIAKFPIDDIDSGAQIKGTSVVELGSGNRPVDMFTYEKDGKQWLVTNTDRFHHSRRPLGPSQYWGVRVDMSYLGARDINEDAARRDVSKQAGPDGIEVVESLFFAKHVAKLSNKEMVVLRDDEGTLDLEIAPLP